MSHEDDFDLDLAIPDLETEPANTKGAARPAQPAKHKPAAPDEDFDFGDSFAPPGSASLSLDSQATGSAAGVPASATSSGLTNDSLGDTGLGDDDFEFGDSNAQGFSLDTDEDDFDTFGASSFSGAQADLAQIRQDAAREKGADYPRGVSPNPEDITIDKVDVDVFARFGKTPKNPLLSVPYAWQVWQRKRELLKELQEYGPQIEQAEQARDALLARLVEEQRPLIEKNERFGKQLDDLKGLERVQGERVKALAGANAEYGAQVSAVESEQKKNAAAIQKFTADRAARAKKLAEYQEALARISGQYKRVLFEARALKHAEEQAKEQGRAVDNSKKLQELSRQAAPLKAKVDKGEAVVSQAQGSIRKIDEALRKLQSQSRKLVKKREQVDHAFEDVLDLRSGGVSEIDSQKAGILAEMGRAVLSLHGKIPIAPETLQAMRARDQEVADAFYQQKLRLLAIDSYDKAAFKQGVQLAGVALGLVLILLIVSAFGGDDPAASSAYDEDDIGLDDAEEEEAE